MVTLLGGRSHVFSRGCLVRGFRLSFILLLLGLVDLLRVVPM